MIGSFFFCFHNPAELLRCCGTFPDQNCDQNYSKKPCTRREIMNFLIDKIDLFCSKIRIFRTWTFSRADGIQEVSGSIPLISTIACFMACILRSTSLFISLKKVYRDDAGYFHRRSSILSPADKGRFHVQKIVKAAFFCSPEMSFIVRHITENPRPPARH